ncbi:MAG: hypothetical protein PVI90_11880 [Desulfobacteraceae bacterium]
MGKADLNSAYHNNKTIYLPIFQIEYETIVDAPENFGKRIDAHIILFSDLFPFEIANDYRMKDFYFSKKLSIWIRYSEITGVAYTIRPSFATPFMTAMTHDKE